MFDFKDRQAIDLDAIIRVLAEFKLLTIGCYQVTDLFVVNFKETDFYLDIVLVVSPWAHLSSNAFEHVIDRVVHEAWLVLVPNHCVCFTSASNAVCKDCCIVTTKHDLGHILDHRFIDLPIRTLLSKYHVETIVTLVSLTLTRHS